MLTRRMTPNLPHVLCAFVCFPCVDNWFAKDIGDKQIIRLLLPEGAGTDHLLTMHDRRMRER